MEGKCPNFGVNGFRKKTFLLHLGCVTEQPTTVCPMEWCSTFPSSTKNWICSAAQQEARFVVRALHEVHVCLACRLNVQNVELESSEWAPCFACDTCRTLVFNFHVNGFLKNPTWAGLVRTWNVFLHYVIVVGQVKGALQDWRLHEFVCGLLLEKLRYWTCFSMQNRYDFHMTSTNYQSALVKDKVSLTLSAQAQALWLWNMIQPTH